MGLVNPVLFYLVPVMPVVIGVMLSVPVAALRYTLYALAPVLAVHDSFTCALPAVAISPVGAAGEDCPLVAA